VVVTKFEPLEMPERKNEKSSSISELNDKSSPGRPRINLKTHMSFGPAINITNQSKKDSHRSEASPRQLKV